MCVVIRQQADGITVMNKTMERFKVLFSNAMELQLLQCFMPYRGEDKRIQTRIIVRLTLATAADPYTQLVTIVRII
jgi:hypothetical protein